MKNGAKMGRHCRKIPKRQRRPRPALKHRQAARTTGAELDICRALRAQSDGPERPDCPSWNRTKIRGSKGRCLAVRRRGRTAVCCPRTAGELLSRAKLLNEGRKLTGSGCRRQLRISSLSFSCHCMARFRHGGVNGQRCRNAHRHVPVEPALVANALEPQCQILRSATKQ